MITRRIAAQCFGYDFQIIDNAGTIFNITSLDYNKFIVDDELGYSKDIEITFDEIGRLYFILARPMEMLTTKINAITPLEYIQERGKLATAYYIYKDKLLADYADGVNVLSNWEEQYLLELNFAINLPKGTWKEIGL